LMSKPISSYRWRRLYEGQTIIGVWVWI